MNWRMRFVLYLVIACVASTLQFDLFDCNDARPLSFAAGALTILVALVAIDRLYTFGVSVRPALIDARIVARNHLFPRSTHLDSIQRLRLRPASNHRVHGRPACRTRA